MVPVIALVGRPNVGKSTLFNRLTKSRDAIVAEYAGLTRDRQYGEAKWQGRTFIVIDTGGFPATRKVSTPRWPSSRCWPSKRPMPCCSWSTPRLG